MREDFVTTKQEIVAGIAPVNAEPTSCAGRLTTRLTEEHGEWFPGGMDWFFGIRAQRQYNSV